MLRYSFGEMYTTFANNTTVINDNHYKFTDLEVSITLVIMAIISITTIFGNFLVFLAFITEKKLRSPTNYLILSLSIADIFEGAFSINLYAQYIHSNNHWMFGPRLCMAWLSLDYCFFQASVFGVLIITIERFLVIRYPLINHVGTHSSRRVKLAIVLKWVVSFAIWLPTTLSQYELIKATALSRRHCILPFTEKVEFVLATGLVSYLIPVTIMIFIAVYTWHILRECKQKYHSASSKRKKQLIKISRFVLLMAAAFSFTILPYGTFSIIMSISPGLVGERSWRAAYILGYVNSMLNPVCYAFGNKRINTVFKRIICNRCKNERTRKTGFDNTTIMTEDARNYMMNSYKFSTVTLPRGKLSNCPLPNGKISSTILPNGKVSTSTLLNGKVSNCSLPNGKISRSFPSSGKSSNNSMPRGKFSNTFQPKEKLLKTSEEDNISNFSESKEGKLSTDSTQARERLPSRLSKLIPSLRSTNV